MPNKKSSGSIHLWERRDTGMDFFVVRFVAAKSNVAFGSLFQWSIFNQTNQRAAYDLILIMF